jgi:hypothetical protein
VVKDALIIKMVTHIGEHYRTNIDNRFVRPALLQAPLEKQVWDLVEAFTKKTEDYETQGFHVDDLYHQIVAAAQFVSVVRRDVAPVLRHRLQGADAGQDKVFREMAVNTFNSNIKIFADLINELYVNLVEMDKAHAKGHNPLYMSIPGIDDVGRLLAG